ncbi:MAG: hypothetical protein PGN09_11980 [Sphingomonas fennica]
MRPARSFTDPEDVPWQRRAAGFALAIAANALLLWLLANLAPGLIRPPRPKAPPAIFDLSPDADASPSASQSETAEARAAARRETRAVKRPAATPPPPPPETPPPPAPTNRPLPMILLSRDEFAAADIGRLPRPAATAGDTAAAGESADAGAGDAAGGGGRRGPNGQRLFPAQWYREPTDAELATYLPRGAPPGYGDIACRTVADYRVEDCVELDESPPGSGYSRAVRQAAWQFRVLPPRIGARRMVGEWVSIRITYSERGARP